jgi:hypothetical protein
MKLCVEPLSGKVRREAAPTDTVIWMVSAMGTPATAWRE